MSSCVYLRNIVNLYKKNPFAFCVVLHIYIQIHIYLCILSRLFHIIFNKIIKKKLTYTDYTESIDIFFIQSNLFIVRRTYTNTLTVWQSIMEIGYSIYRFSSLNKYCMMSALHSEKCIIRILIKRMRFFQIQNLERG